MPDNDLSISLFSPFKVAPRKAAWALGFGLVTALSSLGLMACSALLIVRSSLRPPVFSLAVLMGFVQLFALSRAVARYLERLAIHDAAFSTLSATRRTVFRTIRRLVPGGLGAHHDAEVTTSAISDVDALEHLYIGVLPPIVVGTVAGIVSICLAGLLVPVAATALTAGLVLTAALLPVGARRLALSPQAALERALMERHRLLVEVTTAPLELSTSPRLSALLVELASSDHAIASHRRRLAWRRGAVAAASVVTVGGTILLVTHLSAAAVSTGALAATSVAVLPLLAMAAFEVTAAMTPALGGLPQDRAAQQRLQALLALPSTWPDPPQVVHDVATADSVELSHVVIGHDHPLAGPLDLVIAPGSRIAIVGRSGTGKSTLLDALARFTPPWDGEVSISGAPIDEVTGNQVRSRVLAIEQDPHLFSSTLAANVLVARPDAQPHDVVDALAAVGLAGRSFGDPATVAIEELGANLSGGERQRVGIARALLSNAPIVMIDEPTEGLDDATARQVIAELDARLKDRALVIVTHRSADWAAMDEVFELSEGGLTRLR